jgi:hypothetical protein
MGQTAISCTDRREASPEARPHRLTHTVFILGPQVSKIEERIEVIRLVVQFEKNHLWNTSWIISALEAE